MIIKHLVMPKKADKRKIVKQPEVKLKHVYTEEQRLQVCKLIRDSGRDFIKVAHETGINVNTLRMWATRYQDRDLDNVTSVISQRIEYDLSHLKMNFISKNYEKMDNLADAALDRAMHLIKEETDLNKVNNTIKILTDFMAKMHNPDKDDDKPGGVTTINLIQQSIQQLNQFHEKEKRE